MSDATNDFFEGLRERGRDPLFGPATGTLRIELVDGKQTERWLVAVDKSGVAVSQRDGDADCSLRAPKDVFDGMARGEVNGMAAILRGDVDVEGDTKLLIRFQRLLPSPPASAKRRTRAAKKRSRR